VNAVKDKEEEEELLGSWLVQRSGCLFLKRDFLLKNYARGWPVQAWRDNGAKNRGAWRQSRWKERGRIGILLLIQLLILLWLPHGSVALQNTRLACDWLTHQLEDQWEVHSEWLQAEYLESLLLPCPPREDLSNTWCAAIAADLKVNSSLGMFNLPHINLNDNGLWHIAQGLTLNKSVKKIVEVGVSKDDGDKGLEALKAMLEKNCRGI
jgi:hypothetical protein